MKLRIATPTEIVLEADGVRQVRAEDETGAFGVRPGHADFVTVLPVSVVTWTGASGQESHVLVRRGVFTVRGGHQVAIAAREAWAHDDLDQLAHAALGLLAAGEEAEAERRTADARMHLAAMRQIERLLAAARPERAMPPLARSAPESPSGGTP